jgi:DNA-binding XRE family transcriptional regulator
LHLKNHHKLIIWVSYPVVLCPSNKEHHGMAKPSPQHAGNSKLLALGNGIKSSRLSLGMSQEALAANAGLDRSYMGGVERGEHNLTLMAIVRISSALNLKVYDLLRIADI